MLILAPTPGGTATFVVDGLLDAQLAATQLAFSSTSFYCEPLPDDEWRFVINKDARGHVGKLFADSGLYPVSIQEN